MATIPVSNTLHSLEAVEFPEDASELSTVSLMCVLSEVADERYRQDKKWGGSAHDDQHRAEDFERFIRAQLTKDIRETSDSGYRKRLINVAALAVAAVQKWDRQNTRNKAAACTEGLRQPRLVGPAVR